MTLRCVMRTATWLTAFFIAVVTTVGVLSFGMKIGEGGEGGCFWSLSPWAQVAIRIGASVLAIAPWWAMAAVLMQRDLELRRRARGYRSRGGGRR
jgi:hypothetical protein